MFADESIALITKLRGNAKYKIASESKFKSNVQVNTPLFTGNKIKTKSQSFSQVVYLDDRSTVSIYPKTEVTINGTIEKRMIRKHVDVSGGILRVKVFDQIISEFKLTTPNSELTCNKCDFWIISEKKAGDHFYKISGNITVKNPSMIENIKLVNDSTIISLKGTKMEISHTTITDRKYLESLMIDFNELPEKLDKELAMRITIEDQLSETIPNVVEIRLKNALNIERKIILTYIK